MTNITNVVAYPIDPTDEELYLIDKLFQTPYTPPVPGDGSTRTTCGVCSKTVSVGPKAKAHVEAGASVACLICSLEAMQLDNAAGFPKPQIFSAADTSPEDLDG